MQRIAAVLVTLGVLVAAPPLQAVAADDTATHVDYSWIPTPHDIVEMRAIRERLKVPSLLDMACRPIGDSDFGEDYMTKQLARVELLRMLETEPGTGALHTALNARGQQAIITSPTDARDCLAKLAPDWAKPLADRRDSKEPGWKTVLDALMAVPYWHGVPGTEDEDHCGKGGDADISMALALRTWLRARDHYPDAADLAASISRKFWLQGGPDDTDEVVCEILGANVPETENHRLLIWTSRFLHNEHLPPITRGEVLGNGNRWVTEYDGDSFDYNNRSNGLYDKLNGVFEHFDPWHVGFAGVLRDDFLEYNSRAYSRYQMIALLNLYDLARDQGLRSKVRATLDFLMAKNATEAMGELRDPPFRRRQSAQGPNLFNSDPISPMAQVWVGDLAPYLTPDNLFAGEGVIAASSSYRPPDVLADLMLNPRDHRFRQGFNGRGQHERAFGQPDYTLSGGGWQTDCPYPNPGVVPVGGHCPGSGNDSGTSEPIVLVPRRTAFQRTGSLETPIPKISEMIHSTNPWRSVIEGNTCIGYGVACAPGFNEGDRWVKDEPACRVDVEQPDHDRMLSLRFDQTCTRTPHLPANTCFFVHIREIQAAIVPFMYLVTHNCDARRRQDNPGLFRQFIDYVTTGPGAPGPVESRGDSAYGVVKRFSVRPPATIDGPLEPGDRVVTFNAHFQSNGNKIRHYVSDPAFPDVGGGVPAQGDIATFESAGVDWWRLRLSDPDAGEGVIDNTLENSVTSRFAYIHRFRAHGSVVSSGGADVITVTPDLVTFPGKLHSARVTVRDEAGQVVATSTVDYPYGRLADGAKPVSVNVATPTADHVYRVEACVSWWRFFTSEEYAPDPRGPSQVSGTDRCTRFDTRP